MEKRIIELYRRKFDDIRHEADGIEYWYARELMKLLDYVQWRNFDNAINKAMISCENNGNVAEDHFSRINNTIEVGNGALREVEDYRRWQDVSKKPEKENGTVDLHLMDISWKMENLSSQRMKWKLFK